MIGFEGRRDYGVIGNVTNLAARLCGEAQASQILTVQPQEVKGIQKGLPSAVHQLMKL